VDGQAVLSAIDRLLALYEASNLVPTRIHLGWVLDDAVTHHVLAFFVPHNGVLPVHPGRFTRYAGVPVVCDWENDFRIAVDAEPRRP
jgi:hypothetical protein